MTPEERASVAIRLYEMNKSMRELREQVDAAALVTKELGETGLAFATYFLSEAIGGYMEAVNQYASKEFRRE